jgi:hypothetical protein
MTSPPHDSDPEAARALLIELFDADERQISRRALEEGRAALHWLRNRLATECEIIDYILKRLRDGCPIARVELVNYTGVAWAMKNVDGRDTYIKVQIAEDGLRYYALVLSCHASVHKKK